MWEVRGKTCVLGLKMLFTLFISDYVIYGSCLLFVIIADCLKHITATTVIQNLRCDLEAKIEMRNTLLPFA